MTRGPLLTPQLSHVSQRISSVYMYNMPSQINNVRKCIACSNTNRTILIGCTVLSYVYMYSKCTFIMCTVYVIPTLHYTCTCTFCTPLEVYIVYVLYLCSLVLPPSLLPLSLSSLPLSGGASQAYTQIGFLSTCEGHAQRQGQSLRTGIPGDDHISVLLLLFMVAVSPVSHQPHHYPS